MSELALTYSVAEAARALGVGRNTVYELIRTGQLPHIKLGRRLLISRAALRELAGAPAEEDEAIQPRGKDKDREKEENSEEMTYIITIRRVPSASKRVL